MSVRRIDRESQISARLAFRRFFEANGFAASETGSIFKVIEFQTDFGATDAAVLPYD